MDRVCRTCMRVIEDNETVSSINETDLREKLQVCLPELVLDNVVDPKMCNTCSAALSLSFRFKGMCNEAERTINNCLQYKTTDGTAKPLDKNDLLTLSRRESKTTVRKHEETPKTKGNCLESLQILSDVASQATKADTPNNVSPNLKEKIHDQHNVSNHIDKAIEAVVTSCLTNSQQVSSPLKTTLKQTQQHAKIFKAPKSRNAIKSAKRKLNNTKCRKVEIPSPQKVSNDVINALESLLKTPEYKQLLQLQPQAEGADIIKKLQQFEELLKKKVHNRTGSKRRALFKETEKPPIKKPAKIKSTRTLKALKDIDLDLAEINDGVEQQNRILGMVEKMASNAKKEVDKVTALPYKSNKNRKSSSNTTVEKTLSHNKDCLPISKTPNNPPRANTLTVEKTPSHKKGDSTLFNSPNTSPLKSPRLNSTRNLTPKLEMMICDRDLITPIPKRKYIRKQGMSDGRALKSHQPPQTCPHCNKIFKYISHLQVHLRAHVVLKNFKCELCSKSFTLERNLVLHTIMHFTAGNNRCSICEKYFSSSHVLKKHKLTHTGERPHACVICSRRFTQKVNLETHMRTHSGTKDFVCFICKVAFGQKAHLKGHMRTHTGEKPFKCDLCPKAFAKKNVLRDHKALHSTKPFMCKRCYTLFPDEVCLKRHLHKYRNREQHSANKNSNKVYNCGICSRFFISKFSRDRHMKVHVKDLIEGIIT